MDGNGGQAVAGDYPVLGSGFDAENLTQPWGLFAGVEDTSRMLSGGISEGSPIAVGVIVLPII